MKHLPTISTIFAVLLAACSSSPEVTLVAQADKVIPFDKAGTLSVSTQSDSILARNIASDLRDALTESGYSLSGDRKNDYILTINPVQTSYSYAAQQSVSTSSSLSGALGSASFSLYGRSYTSVPYTATARLEGYAASLYDWKLDQNPTLIWRGVVAGTGGAIRGRETAALRLLVSNLGQNANLTTGLKEEGGKLNSPSLSAVSPLSADVAYFFPSPADTVNAVQGDFNGRRYQGYIRTRLVRTNQFEGYLQNVGLSEFKGAGLSTDDLPSWDIGLGAYILKPDGVYTKNPPSSLRELDSRNPQKVISFPLQIGTVNEIQVAGSVISVSVEAKEGLRTPYGLLSDCYKLKRELRRFGAAERNFVWVCRGVGIAKIEYATGRVDELVGIAAAN